MLSVMDLKERVRLAVGSAIHRVLETLDLEVAVRVRVQVYRDVGDARLARVAHQNISAMPNPAVAATQSAAHAATAMGFAKSTASGLRISVSSSSFHSGSTSVR